MILQLMKWAWTDISLVQLGLTLFALSAAVLFVFRIESSQERDVRRQVQLHFLCHVLYIISCVTGAPAR